MRKTNPQREAAIAAGWPCACVRRKADGSLRSIRINPPTTALCRVCKCTRADALRFMAEAETERLSRTSAKEQGK